jgi:hypothetical protein
MEAWRSVESELPAWRGFWDLLEHAVRDPLDPLSSQKIATFAEEHRIEAQLVMRALHVCDLVLGGAATYRLSMEDLRHDLMILSNGTMAAFHQDFLRLYESLGPYLQARLAEATLSDHGKLLVGLDWRVDTVTASDRCAHLDTTVIFLTLRFREGDGMDRITLQLTPQSIRGLKGFIDRFAS